MKYITSTLLLIVGMQVTARAELIYYEKLFELEYSEEIKNVQNLWSQFWDARDENNYTQLGTIRLEEGELLSQPSQRSIHSEVSSDTGQGWSLTGTYSVTKFRLKIKYDQFSKEEVITIRSKTDYNGWYTQRKGGLVFNGNQWPIEGPATVEVSVNPREAVTYRNEGNPQIYRAIRPEQFLRISFTKSLSQFRVSQNQLQALVLPKGVQGMSVIMESSEDLVNWTRDMLGPKATADRPKFFRLRAIKQ
jgi:hypothetical protein